MIKRPILAEGLQLGRICVTILVTGTIGCQIVMRLGKSGGFAAQAAAIWQSGAGAVEFWSWA